MRHWLILALVLALLPGCAMLKPGRDAIEEKSAKKGVNKNLPPVWAPAYDTGEAYDRLDGKLRLHDIAELPARPGATFMVKVRNWTLGPEAIQPTSSGMVYLEQLAVKAIAGEGYEHTFKGKADYSVEIHVLCAAPDAPAPKGKDQATALDLPDDFDPGFPFAWSGEYHRFAQPETARSGCQGLILLAVHLRAEDAVRDVYVARLSVPGCPSEPDCPLSACGFSVGRVLADELGRVF